MENIYKYLGAVITLVLILAGGSATYYVTISDKGITTSWEDTKCGTIELSIFKDGTNKLKCGRNIIAEWDLVILNKQSSYLGDSYQSDDRKTTKTEVSLIDSTPDYFTIEKKVDYKLGSSGSDGILVENYRFQTIGISKMTFNFTPVNNRDHYIVLRMKKFNDKYGFTFLPEDPTKMLKSVNTNKGYSEYYYGGTNGTVFVDPAIIQPEEPTYILSDQYLTFTKQITVTLEDKQEYNNWSEEVLQWFVNETCEWNTKNLSWIDCPYQKKVTITHSDLIREWQELTINGKTQDLSSWNVWCWDDKKSKIWCKSTLDGDGKYKRQGIKEGMSYFSVDYTNSFMYYKPDHYDTVYLQKTTEMIS